MPCLNPQQRWRDATRRDRLHPTGKPLAQPCGSGRPLRHCIIRNDPPAVIRPDRSPKPRQRRHTAGWTEAREPACRRGLHRNAVSRPIPAWFLRGCPLTHWPAFGSVWPRSTTTGMASGSDPGSANRRGVIPPVRMPRHTRGHPARGTCASEDAQPAVEASGQHRSLPLRSARSVPASRPTAVCPAGSGRIAPAALQPTAESRQRQGWDEAEAHRAAPSQLRMPAPPPPQPGSSPSEQRPAPFGM